MASGHTGNVVPGNRLWVRVPCPPLSKEAGALTRRLFLLCAVTIRLVFLSALYSRWIVVLIMFSLPFCSWFGVGWEQTLHSRL